MLVYWLTPRVGSFPFWKGKNEKKKKGFPILRCSNFSICPVDEYRDDSNTPWTSLEYAFSIISPSPPPLLCTHSHLLYLFPPSHASQQLLFIVNIYCSLPLSITIVIIWITAIIISNKHCHELLICGKQANGRPMAVDIKRLKTAHFLQVHPIHSPNAGYPSCTSYLSSHNSHNKLTNSAVAGALDDAMYSWV